jgi:hypothetical protein
MPMVPGLPAQQLMPAADIFAAGERVSYWSASNARWVNTQIHKINRGRSGIITSYDLTAKPRACPARIRRGYTPVCAPPPLEENKENSHDRDATNRAEAHQLKRASVAPGTAVVAVAQKPAAAQKPNAESIGSEEDKTKGRPLAKAYQMMTIVHDSAKIGTISSVPASCEGSGENVPPRTRRRSRSRSQGKGAGAKEKERSQKPAAGMDVVGAVGSSNLIIANCFQPGDNVDYFSDSKDRWVATTVKNIVVLLDKSIIYDLSCKLAVPAKRMRPSRAAHDRRFEYYSHSAKRWLRLPGKVDTRSQNQCQVDPYL